MSRRARHRAEPGQARTDDRDGLSLRSRSTNAPPVVQVVAGDARASDRVVVLAEGTLQRSGEVETDH